MGEKAITPAAQAQLEAKYGLDKPVSEQYFTYLKQIIIPELIYTIVVTIVLYQIVLKINQKLEDEEKRSASKFV